MSVKVSVDSKRVLAALRKKLAESKTPKYSASVIVGYTAFYALFVHEDLSAFHAVGQAKYLSTPARKLRGVMSGIVKTAVARGMKMDQALLLAGLKLQRESQLLVPIDTGLLRASAFTEIERRRTA